jgi:O-antigen/teichoic acid export membrane protein
LGVIQSQTSKNTAISFAGLALGALNILYLYRVYFTIEEFGLINLLASMSVVYSQLSALGTVNTILRFFPFFKSEDKRHQGFLAWVSTIALAGFLLLTLLYVILKPLIEGAFRENSLIFLEYYFTLIPLSFFVLMFSVLESIARAIHKTVISAFLRDVGLRLLTTAGILMVAAKIINFREFVYFFIFANGLILLVLFIDILRGKEFKYNLDFKSIPRIKVKEMFKYGLYSLLAFSSYYIALNIDRIMLGSMVSVEIVGVYTIFLFVATVIAFPTRSLSRISVPVIADSWKRQDLKNINTIYKKTSLILLIVGSLIFIGIMVNEHNIMKILNKPEYYGHFGIFVFLGLSFLIDATGGVNSDILSTSDKYRYDTLFNFIFLLAVVIFNFVFIPLFGGTGAAIGTTLAMLIFNFSKWYFIKKKYGMQPFGVKHLYVLLIAGFTLALGLLLPELPHFILDVLYRSVIVAAVYGALVLGLKLSDDINSYTHTLLKKFRL